MPSMTPPCAGARLPVPVGIAEDVVADIVVGRHLDPGSGCRKNDPRNMNNGREGGKSLY